MINSSSCEYHAACGGHLFPVWEYNPCVYGIGIDHLKTEASGKMIRICSGQVNDGCQDVMSFLNCIHPLSGQNRPNNHLTPLRRDIHVY